MKRSLRIVLACAMLFMSANFVNAATPISYGSTPPPLLDITNLENIQQAGEESGQAMISLPAIHVTDATINTIGSNDTKITGTITVKNSDKMGMGGLKYQIFLLGKLAEQKDNQITLDNAPEYDNAISDDEFYIDTKSEKKIDFSYNIPSVPKGEYRIRLQILTSKGWRLGWMDKEVTIGNVNTSFILLQPRTVVVPATKEEAAPDQGINVAPNSEIQLNYLLKNTSKENVTLTPQIKVWEFYRNRTFVEKNDGQTVDIPAGKTQNFSFVTKTAEKPESYYVELTMLGKNNKISSNVLSYRWVVTGESAEITTTRIEKVTYGNGEILPVVVAVIGAADRKTPVNAYVSATVKDGVLESGTEKTDPITINDSARIVKLNVRLSRTVNNPEVNVKIISNNGTVLDEDIISLPIRPRNNTTVNTDATNAQKVPSKPSSLPIVGLSILIFIIVIFALVAFLWKKYNKKATKTDIVILLLMIVGIAAVGLHVAKAVTHKSTGWEDTGNGFTRYEVYCYGAYDNRTLCTFVGRMYFDNSPVWGATYSGRTKPSDPNSDFRVPVSGYVSLIGCQNSETEGNFFGTTVDTESPKLKDWKLWGHWSFVPNCGGEHKVCWTNRNFSGFITYPSTTTNAWVQTWMKELLIEGEPDSPNKRDWWDFHRVNFVLAGTPVVDLKVNGSDLPLSLTPTGSTISVNPSWINVASAVSCMATSNPIGEWSGSKAITGGTESINLNAGTNYTLTLTCTGPTGLTGTDSVVVNVGTALYPSPTVTLTPNTTNVNSGVPVTLTWSSTNTSSCPNNNFGALGTGITGNGTDTPTNPSTTDPLNKTYSVTCNGLDGTQKTGTANVTVNPLASLTCVATPQRVLTGSIVTFAVSGGTGNGYDFVSPLPSDMTKINSTPLTAKFSSSGSKSLTVKDDGGHTASCNTITVTGILEPGNVKEQ